MNWQLLVDLIDKLAWPVVVVIVLVAFRAKLATLIDRAREFEGPGDVKIKLDPSEVERIVDEGRKQDAPADVVARRILTQALVDNRELRILRALIGEDEGRGMYSYNNNAYYRPALESLLGKGLIEKRDGKFFLSDSGHKVVAEYLKPILANPESTKVAYNG
jgi:hypothetical protein